MRPLERSDAGRRLATNRCVCLHALRALTTHLSRPQGAAVRGTKNER